MPAGLAHIPRLLCVCSAYQEIATLRFIRIAQLARVSHPPDPSMSALWFTWSCVRPSAQAAQARTYYGAALGSGYSPGSGNTADYPNHTAGLLSGIWQTIQRLHLDARGHPSGFGGRARPPLGHCQPQQLHPCAPATWPERWCRHMLSHTPAAPRKEPSPWTMGTSRAELVTSSLHISGSSGRSTKCPTVLRGHRCCCSCRPFSSCHLPSTTPTGAQVYKHESSS